MAEVEGTYFIEVKCANCGWTGTAEIEKGKAITEAECPNCRVRALVKPEEIGEEEV